MKINIEAKNLDLNAPLKEYINEKIGGISKFLSGIEKKSNEEAIAWVEVARTTRHHHKGDVFYAECDLKLPHGSIRAEDENYDIRVAIDNVRDKLRGEIEKYKDTKKS